MMPESSKAREIIIKELGIDGWETVLEIVSLSGAAQLVSSEDEGKIRDILEAGNDYIRDAVTVSLLPEAGQDQES